MSTTIGQRFVQLVQHLGITKNAFALSLGKTATVIQHLVDERNKPGYDLLCKVFEVYPNVSKDWLLLGQGPLLLPAATSEAPVAGTLVPVTTPAAPVAAIDLTALAGPARRRASPTLQPADVAATLALAARPPSPTTLPPAATPPTPPTPAIPATPIAPPSTAASAPLPASPVPLAPPVSSPPAATANPLAAAAAPAGPEAAPAPGAPSPSQPLPDPAYLAAALQAQHLQHQLALAEQRNQHLLEQQALLRQLVELLQKS